MIYKDFQGIKLSSLGFGTMRLPTLADGTIDQDQVEAMTAYAMEHGINYFDTAWPYHGGHSEISIGKALSKYPRESWYLATKYPGHQISKSYNPAEVFEEQLKKCCVDYFDFYLLHNVYENSIGTYLDERWGIIEYFKEQKRLGRIKHLGFSCHGRTELLKEFLDAVGDDMEFCQIQLNYLDWTLQDAKRKVELLNERNIPIWVMEPVRGGRLAKLDEPSEEKLKSIRPDESIPAWGFRFLQSVPGVTMVLSGMSNMEQMADNIKIFTNPNPLSREEIKVLLDIAEGMKDSIPCTACRYCTKECPMGLDKFSGWIMDASDQELDYPIRLLNRLQTIKRKRELSSDEIGKLLALVEDSGTSEECKVGAYLLLDQQHAAEIHFAKLGSQEKESFSSYPIYHFWK